MPFPFICFRIRSCHVLDDSYVVLGWCHRAPASGSRGKAASGCRAPPSLPAPSSGETPARDGAEASAAAVGGSASSFVAPPAQVVVAPSVAAAVAPGSPAASTTSSEYGPAEVHLDIPILQWKCDLARGCFSAASVEIERLRKSQWVVEVARGAVEEEARVARDAAADAQPRAFGEFCSWSCLPSPVFPAFHNFYLQCWGRSWTPFAAR